MKSAKNLFFLIILSLFISCSQTRKAGILQSLHNFNSRYNTYFNSKERFIIANNSVKKTYKDDYTNILPLFELDNSEQAFLAQADLNAIETKVGKLVFKHPSSRWADNGILLVGKSQYLKGEYAKAIKTLEYITSEYKKGFKTEELKKPTGKLSKKEQRLKDAEKKQIPIEEKKFEHSPSRQEALIFLIKSYIKLGKYTEAQSIISYAESDMYFPKEQRPQLQKVQAMLYIEQKIYSEATKSLTKLLTEVKNKKTKARICYIIGQLNELSKNVDSSYKYYSLVLKNNPNDEMEFNASMKIARMSKGNSNAESSLLKMAKETKNEDFLDVIYYELGEIKRNENNDTKSIEYYKKSIETSVNNGHQKALSYIRIGEYYFDRENYISSHPPYDSSTGLFNKKNTNYNALLKKVKSISELSKNQKIIYLEDSLQELAKLGKEGAKKKIKSQLKGEQKLLKQNEAEREYLASIPVTTNKTSGSKDWYFGNTEMMQNGYAEFKRIWKDRKLDDDWRRSNKSNNSSNNVEVPTVDKKPETPELSLDETADKALEAIPFDDKGISASNEKIIEAYYQTATVFKDQLEDYPKAIKTYEELLKRFPKNKYTVESLYELYILNGLIGDEANANKYKNLLLKNHPDSELAKEIINPSAKRVKVNENENEEKYYQLTFDYFTNNNCDTTIINCNQYKLLYPKELFKEKMKLMKAICLGKKYEYKEYTTLMNELATKSPDTAVMKTAKDLLGRFLSSNLPRINTDTVKRDSSKITYNLTEDKLSMVGKIDSSKLKLGLRDSLKVTPGASTTVGTSSTIPKIEYKLDLKSTHAFIAILNNDINSNNLINAITSYNAKNFSTMRLDVNNLKIGDKNTILIQSFSDGNKAGFYLKFIEAEKGIFDSYKKEDYTLYHISSDNLTTVLKNGHLNDYDQFYKEHYK